MKNVLLAFARIVLISTLILSMASSASARKEESEFQTGFTRWRAADGQFSSWARTGVSLNSGGELQLNPATAISGTDPYAAGSYSGRNYYNGGSFLVGEATSPEITTPFSFTEAIASWNASTPPGSWVEIQFRAQYAGTRWSKWYILGIWASDYSTIERHSVRLQGDADGFVAVDTFVSSNKKETTNKFQLKFLLFSEDGTAIPQVRNASVAYSTSAPKHAAIPVNTNPRWNTLLNVPECSQMVYPGEGGEVWCSPTSTSMVVGYWNSLGYGISTGATCEARVRAAVDGVFDWIYDGHGNWPFNTAYAATKGYEGYVARFTSLEKMQEFVAAGVPVITSIAWDNGDMTNAYISSTNGHLLAVVGFDADGNPIVNDPAWPADDDVQHMYLRSEFEHLWLEASAGTVYLIYPEGYAAPNP